MPRQAAEQALEAEPGDQQGAEAEGRSGEPVQGDDEPETPGDRGPGAQLRQLEPAAAEGAAGRVELLRGIVSERQVRKSGRRDPRGLLASAWLYRSLA